MVARPPVAIVVDRMTVDDLIAVHVIERESFSTPWPEHAYRQEIEQNRLAHYIVARYGNAIVGFAGIWLLVDEAHITTFATRTAWRRQGIGEPRRKGGHPGGPAVEYPGQAAVREVRLQGGRRPAALLQRQQRGRSDHDDRHARRAADAGSPGHTSGVSGGSAGHRTWTGRAAD
jgi:GNAT superfamily N-acetyltransferase